MKTIKTLLPILLILFAFSCSDSDEAATGRASISITDAPIDDANVKAVFITVTGVEVNGPDGWTTVETFEEPQVIDLLSYQNGESKFLTEEVLAAGVYQGARLQLNIQERVDGDIQNPGCYIEYVDGSTQPLFVPSGAQSGYKAQGEFEIPAGGVVEITLDFDVRKAVVEAGNSGQFILKPVVRLVANQDAGLIQGTFDAESNTAAKVVVFAYNDDTFTDSETDEPADEEVRFSNAVSSSTVSDEGNFTLAFMSSGTYDLYFATYDENGDFIELLGNEQDVDVAAGAVIEIDLSLSGLLN